MFGWLLENIETLNRSHSHDCLHVWRVGRKDIVRRQTEDIPAGTWETLSLDENGVPFLERRDVWGFANRRDLSIRGMSFG